MGRAEISIGAQNWKLPIFEILLLLLFVLIMIYLPNKPLFENCKIFRQTIALKIVKILIRLYL